MGAFRDAIKYHLEVMRHNMEVEITRVGTKIILPKTQIKWYVYEVLEPIDFVYHAHDIHNGMHVKYAVGEEVSSREEKDNVYAIIYSVRDKLKFKEVRIEEV